MQVSYTVDMTAALKSLDSMAHPKNIAVALCDNGAAQRHYRDSVPARAITGVTGFRPALAYRPVDRWHGVHTAQHGTVFPLCSRPKSSAICLHARIGMAVSGNGDEQGT